MPKRKVCPTCNTPHPTDNKGRIKPHSRWNWPRWPSVVPPPKSHEMHEVTCKPVV